MILPSLTRDDPTTARESPWRRRGLLALTALSAYSTGIAWQAQAVSYPLFREVPAESFLAYHEAYNRAIPVVVIVPGFLTFLTSIAFLRTRPSVVPSRVAALVAASGTVSLLSTVLWAIPMHDRLDRIGQSQATIDSLLDANLVRSLSLTAGTAVLMWCVARTRGGEKVRD